MLSGMGAGKWKEESPRVAAMESRTPSDASAEGEEDAFEEHLTDEASTRGAEGDADGHLALAAVGLGEEKICDVGAGDAENEESYDHQGMTRKARTVERSRGGREPACSKGNSRFFSGAALVSAKCLARVASSAAA